MGVPVSFLGQCTNEVIIYDYKVFYFFIFLNFILFAKFQRSSDCAKHAFGFGILFEFSNQCNQSIGGSVVESSPATRGARVRFPANALMKH